MIIIILPFKKILICHLDKELNKIEKSKIKKELIKYFKSNCTPHFKDNALSLNNIDIKIRNNYLKKFNLNYKNTF